MHLCLLIHLEDLFIGTNLAEGATVASFDAGVCLLATFSTSYVS